MRIHLKFIFGFIGIISMMLACHSPSNTGDDEQSQSKGQSLPDSNIIAVNQPREISIRSVDLLSLSDAKKILGENAHVSDSSASEANGQLTVKRTFTADNVDLETRKKGNIYFMFEHFDQDSSAHKIYSDIKKANEGHPGIMYLSGVGDEAYFHSDGENFYFVLVRKDSKLLRMKLSKITSHSSKAEFLNVTRKIVADM